METKWMEQDWGGDRVILAGDAGGTNTSIALVGEADGEFSIIMKCAFKSAEITDCFEAVEKTLSEAQAKRPRLKPDICCISGAGPVENNYCRPTNIAWNIDGDEIEKKLGVKTLIINDFMAISYSLPLLDVNDPDQITPLRHMDGSMSEQTGNMRAVVGAGTGLGVGFLLEDGGKYTAIASEGGHIGFAPFDQETREFQEYLVGWAGDNLEAELCVSGQGIINIFRYFRDVRGGGRKGVLAEIDQAPDTDKPRMISQNAETNTVCRDILRLFVKLYGRLAGDVATIALATMGVYLAGGIITKDEKYFLENDLFMRYFEECYNPNIRRVLKSIPVYIIKDYSVSLYGAANAGCCLMV
jgi:glucokinase